MRCIKTCSNSRLQRHRNEFFTCWKNKRRHGMIIRRPAYHELTRICCRPHPVKFSRPMGRQTTQESRHPIEALAEFGTRELCNLEPLLFCSFVCCITPRVSMLLADVNHVGVVDNSHAELCRVFLAHLLSLESSIEAITGQGALRP